MLKPIRATAVRRSVTVLPLKFSAAEFEICSRRAARAGSEPITRTTLSGVTLSSASTLRTRSAISGKLGRSTLPLDSSAANDCTNAKAAGSDWVGAEACAVLIVLFVLFWFHYRASYRNGQNAQKLSVVSY
jgi:hypothetical protein